MVVYRLLKMVRYIIYTIKIDASELADRLAKEIFSKFNVSRLIISDRGSVFTLKYWFIIYYHLIVKRNISIIFYP
jgi:hypothetical protein